MATADRLLNGFVTRIDSNLTGAVAELESAIERLDPERRKEVGEAVLEGVKGEIQNARTYLDTAEAGVDTILEALRGTP